MTDDIRKDRIGSVCHKNRSGLRTADIDMPNTVLFFLRSRIFMFFDYLMQIIINRYTSSNARLCSAVHGQFVQIITFLFILNKNALGNLPIQHFFCFFINTVRIHIHRWVKLCLRAVNIEKRQRMPFHFLRCFFSVIDIIRQSRHLRSQRR